MDEEREAELVAELIDAEPPGRDVPVPTKPDLTPNQLAAMARDIATNVYEIEDIVKKYNITTAQFAAHIHPNGFFKNLLQSYAAEWESIKSTDKRLKFQAAAALEESLPTLAHRMGSKGEDFADAIGAAKLFAQLAGAGEKHGDAVSGGERFSIQINIGDRTVAIASDQQPALRQEPEGDSVRPALRQEPEGDSARPALPMLSEGPSGVLTLQPLPAGGPTQDKI